jgi:FPC/CPF motif-containing protein YcgG
MNISFAERRQIENEMIFRRMNEKVGDDLDTLDAMHVADGHHDLVRDADLELAFKCECSDENCSSRIPIRLDEYQRIHRNRDTFVVLPDHQVDPIEKVILQTSLYNIVKKNNSTDEPSDILNTTTIRNL